MESVGRPIIYFDLPYVYRIIMAALSGLILTLSYPDFNLSYLAWVALVPFFIAIRGVSPRKAFLLGFIMGNTFFVSLAYWVQIFFVAALPAVSLISSTYIGLLTVVVNWTSRRFPKWELLIVPALWVSVEFYRTLGFLRFPWGILGYSQYQILPIIQIASFTGVFGISFLIALTNLSLAKVISEYTSKGWRVMLRLAPAAVLIAISLVYGFSVVPEEVGEKPVKIALVQPYFDSWQGINQGYGFDRQEKLDTLFALSQHAMAGTDLSQEGDEYKDLRQAIKGNGIDETPDIIFWPESTIAEFIFAEDKEKGGHRLIPRRDTTLRIEGLLKGNGAYLLMGSYMTIQEEGRTRYFNSAYLLSPEAEVLDTYSKIGLVPFGEALPLHDNRWVQWFAQATNHGNSAGGFTPGDRYTVFETPKGRFSVPICYEGALGSTVRRFVDAEADFIANISNDSWMFNYSGYHQHFSTNIFRAVENRVYFVRSGNDGVSSIIDPYGRIEKLLDPFKRGVLTGRIALRQGKTFYTQYGDVFVYICIFISLLAVILSIPPFSPRIKPSK